MKILIVQTGGTIDKDYPMVTKGYAFEITDPAVIRILADVNPSFEYQIVSAMKKDSQEITSLDRQKLLAICQDADETKIIITHGTDTMIETAEVLSVLKNKTIVLTGSMRPERFVNTDADFNLGMAVATAGIASPGVYITMHGVVVPWDKSSRDMATGQFIGKT